MVEKSCSRFLKVILVLGVFGFALFGVGDFGFDVFDDELKLVAATPVELEPVWNLEDEHPNAWPSISSAISDYGNYVFTANGLTSVYAELYSTLPQNPVTPLSHDEPAGEQSWKHSFDCSQKSDVCAWLSLEEINSVYTDLRPTLRVYSGDFSSPDWTYELPIVLHSLDMGDVRVSSDGETIVVWPYNPSISSIEVFVFNRLSNQLIHQIPTQYITGSQHWNGDMSEDGKYLYISSSSSSIIYIMDLESGEVLDVIYYFGGFGNSITTSGDGSVFALINTNQFSSNIDFTADVYRLDQNQGTHQDWFTYDPLQYLIDKIKISKDGSILVLGLRDAVGDTFGDFYVEIIDLEDPSHPVIFDQTFHREEWVNEYSGVMDIEISEDGKLIAVGGLGGGSLPELVVFQKDEAANTFEQVAYSHLPGSIVSMDLGANNKLSVSGRDMYYEEPWARGAYMIYDLCEIPEVCSDLSFTGTPSIGETITINIPTDPNRRGMLINSQDLAATPRVYPSIDGELYLEASTAELSPLGTADSSGVLSFDYQIPDDSSLMGEEIYFQVIFFNGRKLTDDYLGVLIG